MSDFVSQFSGAIEQVLPMIGATYKDIHEQMTIEVT